MKLSLMLATMSLAAAVPRRPPVTNPTDDAVTNSVELTQNVIKGNWLHQIVFFKNNSKIVDKIFFYST